jgi:N-dimethylarginine dimethylaminohydrolase
MSYPGTDWQIRGGLNPYAAKKPPTNPKAAFQEWLRLADAMVKAGARIAVMRPDNQSGLSGLPYTSNHGALFRQSQGAPFYVADTGAKHRKGEIDRVTHFLNEAGVPIERMKAPWGGQSEVHILPGNRVILTHGPRSSKAAVEEARAAVVPGSRVLEVHIREDHPFGDCAMGALTSRNGDVALLVWSGGLADRGVPDIRSFAGTYADVVPIEDPEDAEKLATHSFAVGGHAFVPTGLSTGFRANLVRRGFPIEEIDLPELLGKGGGGPRALVNELRGLVLSDDGPTYANLRDELSRLVETYPEKAVAEKATAPATATKAPTAKAAKAPPKGKKS